MSDMNKVQIMDQFASPVVNEQEIPARTALAHADLQAESIQTPESVYGPGNGPGNEPGNESGANVVLKEGPVIGLLMIRVAQNHAVVSEALHAMAGVGLSERLQSVDSGTYCIRWMSPDSWLLSCPLHEAFRIEHSIRARVSSPIAIVNVSGGFCVLQLCAEKAREVLMKSVPYDVHPDNFPVGKVVNTTFAKTQVTLRCISESNYELVVRRSYSDYVWLWLQRAAAEFNFKAVSLN